MEVQQLLVVKEEVPSEWRPGMDQQVPEPIHMKQEQEELFTGQEGKQLNAQDDADVSRFQFTAVRMKSEIEEEDPPSSQLHQSQTEDKVTESPPSSSTTQIKTETVGKDCGGTNAARNLGMSSHLLPNTNEKSSDSSEHENSYDWQEPLSDTEPETEDNDGSEEMLAINSGINAVKYVDTTVGKIVCKAGKKSLICFYCSKDFYKKVNYDTHMRIHTGEKPFACELCGKRFNHQGHFKIHMRVHTGEKPFACELCGKRFTHQGHLKRHMRVHTGEKPFACELCGKRLTEQAGLNKHMKVHTGEKPFACELCGKRFSRQGILRTHMNVHIGEKLLSCELCGKRFAQKGNLKTHMRLHSGEKPFACKLCGKDFVQQGHLTKHMRFHTGEKRFFIYMMSFINIAIKSRIY